MRGLTVLALAVAALPSLSGCSAGDTADSLYPLDPGLQWEYRLEMQPKGMAATTIIRQMENVSRERFAGVDDVAIRRNNHGTRYYLARRDDGFYRVAVKSVVRHTPIMDQPPTKILPLPATPGTKWSEPAHTYMLGRAKQFLAKEKPAIAITLNYRVEATGVEVDVPAGNFRDCVLAVGEATFQLQQGAGLAPATVPIVQREWYCPGVGLAKLVRDEKLPDGERAVNGGSLQMVLLHGAR